MPNVKQIISNHNKTILTKESSTEDTTNNCNCRVKEKCPVDNKCQTSSLIYQATVTRHDNNKDETCIGLTDNTFKTRYNGHINSFRHENYRNSTALSNYIWMLKDKKISYSLNIVIKNQHFIEYFRLLQTSSEYEMHLSAKYTIYTILDNLHVLYYTILKY